ncbi:zinc finger, CCHC-type containing protein, partial [Tanacetum coccineum]
DLDNSTSNVLISLDSWTSGLLVYRLPLSGTSEERVVNLPEDEHEEQSKEQSLAIYDTQIVLQKGIMIRQVLVQWSERPREEVTWEWLLEFKIAYPSYHLEDNVILKARGMIRLGPSSWSNDPRGRSPSPYRIEIIASTRLKWYPIPIQSVRVGGLLCHHSRGVRMRFPCLGKRFRFPLGLVGRSYLSSDEGHGYAHHLIHKFRDVFRSSLGGLLGLRSHHISDISRHLYYFGNTKLRMRGVKGSVSLHLAGNVTLNETPGISPSSLRTPGRRVCASMLAALRVRSFIGILKEGGGYFISSLIQTKKPKDAPSVIMRHYLLDAYLVDEVNLEGTRDEISNQQSYCFNVEDDPKTFDEAMKLQTSWLQMDLKKKTEVARIGAIRMMIALPSIHNLIIHQMDVKIAFLNGKLIKSLYGLKQASKQKFDESGKGVIICLYVDDMLIFGTDQVQVDLTKEFFSLSFSMKDMGEADVILGIRIKHESNRIAISQSHHIKKAISQLEYSRVIGCLIYAITCRRPFIAFAVAKLSSWISNTEDNLSTSSRIFLLGGGAISWASKKQTCITSSSMEFEFMALAATVKEVECVATLAKVYSQMYNGKSRHLGVSHSLIRELIMNGVVSIEFVSLMALALYSLSSQLKDTIRE